MHLSIDLCLLWNRGGLKFYVVLSMPMLLLQHGSLVLRNCLFRSALVCYLFDKLVNIHISFLSHFIK